MALRSSRQTYESALADMMRANSRSAEYLAHATRFSVRPPTSPLHAMASTLSASVGIDSAAADSRAPHYTDQTVGLVSNAMTEHQNATAHSLEALERLRQESADKKLSRLIALGLGALLGYAIFSSD